MGCGARPSAGGLFHCAAPPWATARVLVGCSENSLQEAAWHSLAKSANGNPSGLWAEAAETLVEARELAAGVEQALLAAGPGRVRFRIDLQAQRVAGLAVGRARQIARPVGHDDRNLVVIGVNFFLHRWYPEKAGRCGERAI